MTLPKTPYNKTRLTIFVYCEGLEDSAFIKHLYNLYKRTNSDPRLKIVGGRGGTAQDIVKDAIKQGIGYDNTIVVMDNDKNKEEIDAALQLAEEKHVSIVLHTPCIEHLLLTILGDKTVKISTKTGRCKVIFETTYFKDKNRTDWAEYESVFPKKLLNKKRYIPELHKLYLLVRGMHLNTTPV